MTTNSVSNKIRKFLDKKKNDCIVDHTWTNTTAIVITDSKGRYCQTATNNCNGEQLIKWWVRGGRKSVDGVKLVQRNIHYFNNSNNNIILYIWLGTNDFTTKVGKYSHLKTLGNESVDDILSNYHIILNLITNENCKVVFLHCPIFSISEYNRHKGHPNPQIFEHFDVVVKNQIAKLNDEIIRLNGINQVHSPHFTVLVYGTTRLSGRYVSRYIFELYRDGLHPDDLLAKAWLMMIVRQVVKDLF